MVILGKNIKGEQIGGDATGARHVLVAGVVVGSCTRSDGHFDVFDSTKSRYKTAEEHIESICRDNDHGISGIGAVAALREMAPYWSTHLAEGHPAQIIADDIIKVKAKLDDLLVQLGISQ